MSRIRTLKPEILEDAKTARLNDAQWRTFVSLILLADDHGNMHADPDRIAAALFWGAPDDARETLASILETLARLSLVEFYEVRGQRFAHIVGWARHQKVDKPSRPRVPTPYDAAREASRDPRETLENDLRSPTSDLRPRNTDQGAGISPAPPPARVVSTPESETQTSAAALEQAEQLLTPEVLGQLFAETWYRLRNVDPPEPGTLELEALTKRVIKTAAGLSMPPVALVSTALEQWAGSSTLNGREKRSPFPCFATAFGELVESIAPPEPAQSPTDVLRRERDDALRDKQYGRYDELNAELRAMNGGRHAAG